jgi:hypothetical protein
LICDFNIIFVDLAPGLSTRPKRPATYRPGRPWTRRKGRPGTGTLGFGRWPTNQGRGRPGVAERSSVQRLIDLGGWPPEDTCDG